MTATSLVTGGAESTDLRTLRKAITRSRLGRAGALVVSCLAAILIVAPVLGTPYAADDVPNSGLPGYLAAHHISRWQNIAHFMGLWTRGEGRFFPGAITESTFVFSTFTSRISYKAFLFVLLICLLSAVGLWLLRSVGPEFAVLAVVVVACCWQFRYPVFFDGITSFSGLVPATVLLMVLSMIALARRPQHFAPVLLIAGAILWAAAIVTYEVAELLAPAAIASLWLQRSDREWRRSSALSILIPTLAMAAIVGWYRAHLAAPPESDFTVILGSAVPATTVKQFLAAIPLSQYWVPDSVHPSSHLGWLIVPVVLLAILVTIALYELWRVGTPLASRRIVLLAGIGGWMWLVPAGLVGVTERWQQQLAWGQGYLAVVFETVGVALVVLAVACALRRVAGQSGSRRHWATAAGLGLLALVGVSTALTAALNVALIQ